MNSQRTENDHTRHTIEDALSRWESKGPTSFTVAVMADALYGAREQIGMVHGLLAAYGDSLEGTPGDYEFLVHQIARAVNYPPGASS